MGTNTTDYNDKYFADRVGEDTASILLAKAGKWFNNLDANGYLDKLREMWAAYHGAFYSDIDDGHRITFGGEQGELANLPVNHFRNIAQNIFNMITATRPAMDARSVNTDFRSQAQTILANGLLDYYMREKRLEFYLKNAVEYAIVLGSGYIKVEWNAMAGDLYDTIEPEVDPETGEILEEGFPVYEGDVQFSNLSPFDVVVDSTKETEADHEWVLTRSFKNRFDLAAKYPELKDKILALHTKDEHERFRFNSLGYEETDDIPVYEFFHRRTESMPDGRYLLFLSDDVVLLDSPMPYDNLPVYRISPSTIMGTPYGYTPMLDLLPLQDAVNSLYSTVMSNQNAFGVQNIIMPRGTDIVPSNLIGGLNLIEYNAQLGKPESLNLTQTPKEIFDFMAVLIKDMETISGVSSVTRGNPEASLNSGAALALVQSMSIQYMSSLQQSYVQLVEDVGTGLIKMLQRFASVPRIALIAGKKNRTIMKEFTGDDLDKINRVIVDMGNPLAKTTAGRVQMADQMIQMGVITDAYQYQNVINTGELDFLTEGSQGGLLLIKSENERLIEGEYIQAVFTEKHSQHIKEHSYILDDPDLKKDPELLKRVSDHIQQHINLLRTTDPDLLAMMGEQPLSPPGGTPLGPEALPGGPINTTPIQQNQGGAVAPAPDAALPPTEGNAEVPDPANPPGPFANLPTNPADAPPQG